MLAVFEICGVGVRRSDAWSVVEDLRAVGRADDVFAAAEIEWGLRNNLAGIDLLWPQREALLDLLVHCPESLVGLRGKLLRDHRNRSGAQ
jgi:hypothetical protein